MEDTIFSQMFYSDDGSSFLNIISLMELAAKGSSLDTLLGKTQVTEALDAKAERKFTIHGCLGDLGGQFLWEGIGLSMAPRNWATVAEESCTTYLTTDVGKSGKVATIWEREETDLTLRPIFRQSRP